jgi:DNA-binding PadR family transcriptional regulator
MTAPALHSFEYALVVVSQRLLPSAYPTEVARELSTVLNREVSIPQVVLSLNRLEENGFVVTTISEARPVRGGRKRRMIYVTKSGADAAVQTRDFYNNLQFEKD